MHGLDCKSVEKPRKKLKTTWGKEKGIIVALFFGDKYKTMVSRVIFSKR